MTKSWNSAGRFERSQESVMIPPVEQDPHLLTMRWMRIVRGATCSLAAQ